MIFIILAAIFKAIADTLSHHYSTSVFKWKDRRFWDPAVSHLHAPFLKFTKYRIDGWHLANSAMIVSFVAVAVYNIFGNPAAYMRVHWALTIGIYGLVFNLVFNLFYNKVLRRK